MNALTHEQFAALFDPRAILVAGASSHPGKFGFVTLHNVLSQGYRGGVYATNRDGGTILGIETVTSVEQLPADAPIDLVFVCTPASANPDLLRACAARGVRAAFITSAGYGEAGDEGRVAERELIELAERLGMLLAGPNGQGVVSTPSKLCAQIVAPYPPVGRIGVASQSGNFVSSFLNYSVQTGIGISRAVSAGNAAMVTVPDYLDFYAADAATSVGLAYVEGIADGRGFYDRIGSVTERMPLVLLKGGATAGGQRAAASHTGALASDDRIFDGMCRQAGATRAATVEEAFEAAASFATQPLPKGPNVAVMTTAGGWGVVTADAITAHRDLTLAPMPADLLAEIDTKLPPRWSRNNPIDLAGGETRDTIPEVMAMVAGHESIDAVVYLGLGHPEQPGPPDARGSLLSRRRPRTHRRLPRTPGRPIRTGRRGDQRRHRQTDPHRNRTRHCLPRQRRAARCARIRPALLRVVEPGRDRTRPPVPVRALPGAPRSQRLIRS